MIPYRRIRIAIVVGSLCIFGMWAVPAVPQDDAETQAEPTEEIESAPGSIPTFSPETLAQATTVEDLEIPILQLEVLLKPMTLSELEIEAAAWYEAVKAKAKEVSRAELAVQRQNLEIQETKEAEKAVQEAEKALERSQEAEVSPTGEAEDAEDAEKLEQAEEKAQEKLEEALAELEEAAEIEEEQKADEEVQEAIESSEEILEEVEAEKEGRDLDEDEESEESQAEGPLDEGQVDDAPIDAEGNVGEAETGEEEGDEDPENVTDVAEIQEEIQAADVEVADLDSDEEKEEVQQDLEKIELQLELEIEEKAEVKTNLLESLNELRDQQTALVDRFDTVLNELQRKGGDVELYRKYADAITAVKIDVQDTEAFWVTVLGWLRSDEGGKRWAINLGKFFGILLGFGLASLVVGNVVNRSLSMIPNMSRLLREFIVNLVSNGLLLVGLLLALTALEVSLGPLLALVGGASFVLAFALQSNLSNFASGLMILFYKPFDVGDQVEIAGLKGYVKSISLASTRLSDMSESTWITVPNETIWSGVITNFTPSEVEHRFVTFPVRVGYQHSIRRVKHILLDVATSYPLVMDQPPPYGFIWEFAEDHIEIWIGASVQQAHYWVAYEELRIAVQERFAEEGISFAIPLGQEAEMDGDAPLGMLLETDVIEKYKALDAERPKGGNINFLNDVGGMD